MKMVSGVNPQTISFRANWDASNNSLKNTIADTVSKVALYLLHRLAITLALPSTGFSKKKSAILQKQLQSQRSCSSIPKKANRGHNTRWSKITRDISAISRVRYKCTGGHYLPT